MLGASSTENTNIKVIKTLIIKRIDNKLYIYKKNNSNKNIEKKKMSIDRIVNVHMCYLQMKV